MYYEEFPEFISGPSLEELFVPEPYKPSINIPKQIGQVKKQSSLFHYLENNRARIEAECNKKLEQIALQELPEVVAFTLLDFLSSKPGNIRHSGSTYRSEMYDKNLIETMVKSIKQNKPIPIFFLSFSPKFQNPELTGNQLMPDLATYLALCNLHNIIQAAKCIYPSGVKFIVSYEGTYTRPLGRYSKNEIERAFEILVQFNACSNKKYFPTAEENLVELIDGATLIQREVEQEKTYGCATFQTRFTDERLKLEKQYLEAKLRLSSYLKNKLSVLIQSDALKPFIEGGTVKNADIEDAFLYKTMRSQAIKKEIQFSKFLSILNSILKVLDPNAAQTFSSDLNFLLDMEGWMDFYRGTIHSDKMFPKNVHGTSQEYYIERMVFMYKAFNIIKYTGGPKNRGLVGYLEEREGVPLLMATVEGNKAKMNFQLVPGCDFYPHHRCFVQGKQGNLEPITFKEIGTTNAGPFAFETYHPVKIPGYPYPFYWAAESNVSRFTADSLEWKPSMGAKFTLYHAPNFDETNIINPYDHPGFYFVKKTIIGRPGELVYDHQLQQLSKLKEMHAAGIKIVPFILYEQVTPKEITYVTPLITLPSAKDVFFNLEGVQLTEGFEQLLRDLDQELWGKGSFKNPEQQFTTRHLPSVIRGIHACENNPMSVQTLTLILNGQEMPNLLVFLKICKEHSAHLDQMSQCFKVPEFTHGDLHFGNVFVEPQTFKPMLIDPNRKQEAISVEFELSRLILSFYRDIIINSKLDITTNGNSISIRYKGDAEKIIKNRACVLEIFRHNESVKKWCSDLNSSLGFVKLYEAIHIATVFHLRPSEQQLSTYFIGTFLLHEALTELKILKPLSL